MTRIFLILSIFSLIVIGCDIKKGQKKYDKLSITYKIIPEYNNVYYITWRDTLGQRKDFNQLNRPLELWCTIKNQKNDTIGHYKGLSTPRKLAYFETNDSIINIDFKVRNNFFSEFYYKSNDNINKRKWDEYSQMATNFETIKLSFKKELYNEINVILNSKNKK